MKDPDILSMLNDDRNDQKLYCDLKIKTGGQTFDVHSNVMVYSSKFFYSMISSELRGCGSNEVEIIGPIGAEISSQTMAKVLTYIYTGGVNVNQTDAKNIRMAAHYMDLPGLKNICSKFCSKIWIIGGGSRYWEYDVRNKSMELLPRKDIDASQQVGFNVDKSSYIFSSSNIQQLRIGRRENGKHIISYTDIADLTEVRNLSASVYMEDCLYIIGGIDNTSTTHRSIDVYRPSLNTVERAGDLIEAKRHHTIVVFGDNIISLGGQGADGNTISSVESFNTKTKVSTFLNPMYQPRYGLCAVTFDDNIVVMGGYFRGIKTSKTLNTVEIYNFKTDEWTFLSPMNRPRYWASACYKNGLIYVVGGRSGLHFENSIESYDISTDQWTLEVDFKDTKHFVGCPLFLVISQSNDSFENEANYQVSSVRWIS